MDETLKIRFLKAIGHDEAMRELLLEIMERSQAEYCAFCAARDREFVYILCENRELALRSAEIRDKVRLSYRMFTNGVEPDREPVERIMFRRNEPSILYLLGNPRIESYFLVPLAFASKVRGVLYLGSVRKEAFGREEIASLRGLAEEEGERRSPLAFRMGGEREMLERILAAMPLGAALVSPDGAIIGSNTAFAETINARDGVPDTIGGIAARSLFSLQGIWDEFTIMQRDIIERELKGSGAPERYASVSCVRVEALAEEVGSLVLVRDVTPAREQAEAREEMVAMVAHELRTPLTALKNSLSIVAEAGSRAPRALAGAEAAGDSAQPREAAAVMEHFIANSLRTIERLGMLVDGLIDSSGARIDERTLRIERHDIRSFIEEASSLFIEPMKKKGIDFRAFVDSEASRLAFDRDRLEQVIQNLLANSIKHVPSGGSVSITVIPCAGCPAAFLPASLLGRWRALVFADLCVRDTGGGIPADVARSLRRYASESFRPIRASQGLGLRVAERLIRLQGGSLEIDEGVIGGSAVHLYLPSDEATFRAIQQYRAAEMRLEEMLSRGLMPVVYCIEKAGKARWEEVCLLMSGSAAINPNRSEPHEGELLVWPFGESFAIGINARERRMIPIPPGVRAGRSVARKDGMNMRELVDAALEMLEEGASVPALKGESE